MDIREALEHVALIGGGESYGYDEWRDLCTDALAEIRRLERVPAIKWTCDCKGGSIAPLFSTDLEHVWCSYCGRGTRPKNAPAQPVGEDS